jgi:hypothetical protein
MVRVHEWKEFELSAREMFAKSPTTTRFSVNQKTKSVEKDGVPKKKVSVTLKVTDGPKTISYETTERFYLKRISTLMQWFTVRMSTVEDLTAENVLKQRLSR